MKIFFFKAFYALFLLLFSTTLIAQSNQYLHFDGNDDYVELLNGAQYLNGTTTATMAGWFYTDALTYGQGMMSIRGGGTGDGQMYIIQLDNGKLECRITTSTGLHEVVAPAGSIQAGTWQHLALVFNQNTLSIYIDGALIDSGSASGTFQSTDRPFSIGKCIQSGFNFVFKGRADEVSLWSKALSASEIQDMMSNELNGDETDLEVYYKFNQGTPGGNNTNINQLIAEGNTPTKNANLMNFALTGETSNFNGTLESGFQGITFQEIPNKLTTDPSFPLEASVNSGLPITFEVVSGPATINGETVSLTGESGEVTIKASQPGNEDWDPAEDVFVSFMVLDPEEVLPQTELLHPIGDTYMPSLMPIKISLTSGIDYPELFSISNISVEIDDETIELTNHDNGFFTGWWTPSSYGAHEIDVHATNNFEATTTLTESVNILAESTDKTVLATDEVWVNADYPSKTVEAELPSHIGAYDQITGTLHIDCPTGGCDPWDRISHVEAQGKDGEWYEIIRYLTPYGVSCESEIDLTDFSSLLKGKTKFRVNLGTQGNGFLYTLELNYHAGQPEHPYSTVKKLWYQTYQFGDMANLQPTEDITAHYASNAVASKIKLVSTGHGWGDNNTGNAAEFSHNIHHIWVDNEETFEQDNWYDCNPNPDGCSPQAGTWQYDRAGWCPGTIAQFFDYDMTPYVNQSSVELKYMFDESYKDYCHPNNPDCVSGSTCPNCDDGFNPHLIVTSYLISFSDNPMETFSLDDVSPLNDIALYPNPTTGKFFIDFGETEANHAIIYDYYGRQIREISNKNGVFKTQQTIDINGQPAGIYLIQFFQGKKSVGTKRIVLE